MLKSLKKLLFFLLDFFLPERPDFSVTKKLDETAIIALPKALKVEGFDWIHALFQYKNEKVRALIWELKYNNNTLPLEVIGKLLYEEIISLTADISLFNTEAEFVLLPMPISKERRVERGYNQAEYIAKAILENDTNHFLLYAPQWFQKIKETLRQSHLESREARIQSMHDCFVADERLYSKYVILIDDVVTTGATLSEARKTLLQKGAREVFAYTIAH